MKKITLNLLTILLLFTLPLRIVAQTTIKLILKSPIKIDSVSVMDITQQEHHILPYKDTLTFKFLKDNIDCYTIRCLVDKRPCWAQVWLNKGKVTVKAHLIDSIHMVIDTSLNSPIYNVVKNYYKQAGAFGIDTAAKNKFMLTEIQKYLETTWSSAIAYNYIILNQNSRNDLLKLKQLLTEQKTDFSWFIFFQMGIARLDKLLKFKEVNLADFFFTDKNGKPASIKLDGYDYYLLDFWFLDCAPCRRDHMWIAENLQQIVARKVKVISISTDEIKLMSRLKSYLIKHNYKWDNYLQSGNITLSKYLGIQAFPAYVLLNAKGGIVSTSDSVANALKQLNLN